MGSESNIGKFHPVTHVIFDMDGLLLDTENLYTEAFNDVCKRYGSKFTNDVKKLSMGRPGAVGAEVIIRECNLPLDAPTFLKEAQIECNRVFQKVDWMPGALELIQHFKAMGVPQCVATGSNRLNFELKTRNKEEFESAIEHVVLGTDPELKHGKPAPDPFLLAASRFSVPPKSMRDVLVFEDSPLGVQAGIAAEMQVVMVPDLAYTDPTTVNPTLVLPSLKHFKPELFGLPAFPSKSN